MGSSPHRNTHEALGGSPGGGRHSGDVPGTGKARHTPRNAGASPGPGGGEEEWRAFIVARAACRGLALTGELDFFAEDTYSERQAKAVCKDCIVRDDCLDWALRNRERFGVWGGLNDRERRKIARTRRKQRRESTGGLAAG